MASSRTQNGFVRELLQVLTRRAVADALEQHRADAEAATDQCRELDARGGQVAPAAGATQIASRCAIS